MSGAAWLVTLQNVGVQLTISWYLVLTVIELCPQLVFLPLSFDKYTKKAEEIREVLARYDERYEAGSCDEAFLNITGVCHTLTINLSKGLTLESPLST